MQSKRMKSEDSCWTEQRGINLISTLDRHPSCPSFLALFQTCPAFHFSLHHTLAYLRPVETSTCLPYPHFSAPKGAISPLCLSSSSQHPSRLSSQSCCLSLPVLSGCPRQWLSYGVKAAPVQQWLHRSILL